MPYLNQGLGCAGSCGGGCNCKDKGMGSLLDPSTWGLTDWLVAAGGVFLTWKLLADGKQRRYTRVVRRRLGVV